MASSADVLKQFLVSIAYKVDATSEKTFVKSIEGTAKVVGGLVGVALGAVTGLAFAVDKVTEKFEQLFYASKRSGTSARDITNFGYAVSQLGGSVEGAQSSLENFGQTLRKSPGLVGMLRDWGINMKDWEHNGLRVLKDTMKYAAKLPGYRQDQIMGQFGIDLRTGYAAMSGTDQFERQNNRKMKALGLDPDEASRRSVDMQQVFRGFTNTLMLLYERISLAFTKAFRDPFAAFNKLVEQLGPTIAARFDEIAEVAAKLAIQLVQGLASPEFQAWVTWITDPATWKGWHDSMSGIGDQIAAILRVALKLAKVIEYLGHGAKSLGKWFTEGYEGSHGGGLTGGLGETDNSPTGSLGGRGGSMQGYEGGTGADASKGHAGANMNAIYQGAYQQLLKEGVTPESAKYAAAALAGNAQQESGGNPNTIHDNGTGYGIYGARLARRDAMLAWTKANGFAMNSPEGQARYMAHEAMTKYGPTAAALRRANAGNLGEVTNIVSGNFESPNAALANNQGRRNNAAAALRFAGASGTAAGRPRIAVALPRAAMASAAGSGAAALGITPIGEGGGSATHITINQQNHVDVRTDHHAGKIAHEVGKEMAKRHGEVVRNVVGATQ